VSNATSAWRSVLFVPADRPDRFAKALASGADAVCCDLEDAVGPDAKSTAREQIRTFLSIDTTTARVIRLNDLKRLDGLRDLLMLAELDVVPDAVWLPKAESAAACEIVHAALGAAIPLIALIETVSGLRQADRIAATQGVAGLVFGSADYAAELGCAMTQTALAVPRARVLEAAAAAGCPAWDGAWADLNDEGGLSNDARLGAELGFVGKPALHPRQVNAINAAFTPSPEQVEQARGVLAASAVAEGGVATFRGKMLDAPVVRLAERTLAAAEAAQNRSHVKGEPA
jgi:citrate lyase beta subunit